MKKEYVKPELTAADGKKFEKVYSGGCSHFPDNLVGCAYSPDWVYDQNQEGIFHSVTSDHHTLAPGYGPDSGAASN